MINYKLVNLKKGEKDQIIEKSGSMHEFTVSSVISTLKELYKHRREMNAQIKLNKAEIVNYEDNHPFIQKLSEKEKKITFLWQRSDSTRNEAQKKLDEIQGAIDETLQAVKDIKDQIGLEIDIPEDKFKVTLTAEQMGLDKDGKPIGAK